VVCSEFNVFYSILTMALQGKIFSAQFCTDSPFQLAVAGSKGNLQVLDLSSNAGVRRAFSNRAGIIVPEVPEVSGLQMEDEDTCKNLMRIIFHRKNLLSYPMMLSQNLKERLSQ
jgi:hypothetical protein